jgi:uncharacterized protein (TIGR02996 family)
MTIWNPTERTEVWIACAMLFACLVSPPPAFAQGAGVGCGSIANAFGPYDYRTERGNHLALVEGAHFTPQVEALISGITGPIGTELDYTLRAYPNHHRALLSLVRFGKKSKSPQPRGLKYPVECYFDRALRFRPDDTTVRMIYANYLFDNGRADEADGQLAQVDILAGENAFTHYNVGLIYFEQKRFEKAMEQARKAYALGFERPELRDKLKAAGVWTDAASNPGRAAASAAVSAAGPASEAGK